MKVDGYTLTLLIGSAVQTTVIVVGIILQQRSDRLIRDDINGLGVDMRMDRSLAGMEQVIAEARVRFLDPRSIDPKRDDDARPN